MLVIVYIIYVKHDKCLLFQRYANIIYILSWTLFFNTGGEYKGLTSLSSEIIKYNLIQ